MGMRAALTSFTAAALLSGCLDDAGAYTLYRSSVMGPNARIHVATFDSKDGNDYNQGNCDVARQLFVAQPGVTVRYWCEKGRYKA